MPYVEYIGKKLPFKFENPILKEPLCFNSETGVVEVSDVFWEWVQLHNPTGFLKEVKPSRLSTKKVLPEKVEKPKKKSEPLMCPHCFKEYLPMHKRFFEKHVAKCAEGTDNGETEV